MKNSSREILSTKRNTVHACTEDYNLKGMNEDNKRRVRELIQEAGKRLEGRLPQSRRHPKGRNPYAHIPQVIKSVLGASYTDLADEDLEAVLLVIEHCEKNPF